MTSEKEPRKVIESALAEFTEAWFSGERPDVDSFCRLHPEAGEDLRREINGFLYVAENLPEFREHREKGSSSYPSLNNADRSSADTEGLLADFKIIGELGRGGMATVYEAEQVSLHRRVALKILPSHLSFSDHAIRKFRREAEAGGRQAHPGIISVYAVGEENGIHYIAQELVEGGRTLAHRLDSLRQGGPLKRGYFRDAARCVSAVADALHHAHASQVIHRDIKPSNILVTADDQPKVGDFGLAKVEDGLALTRSGEFAGTPFYMSPEQVARRKGGIDFRTDIYSLGVTLYEMLTFVWPFDGETTQEVMKRILLDEPKDPRSLNPRVPRDLAVICLKCMEKNPDHRYADMASLKEDLDRFLAGETILARPVGFFTRVGKRFRRNPAISFSLSLAVVALLALLIVVPTQYILNKIKIEKALGIANALKLSGFSAAALSRDPGLALLLAAEGASHSTHHFSNNALLAALEDCLEVKTLFHRSKVNSAAFSPDGLHVATASLDHTVRVWDWKTGKVEYCLKGHTRDINEVNYDISGTRMVTASDDCTALIWNLESGKVESVEPLFFLQHVGPVRAAAFSPDGNWVVTASRDLTA
ncbi:MAG: serine/threonine-protein kinase, partial [Planctomycetota bacterium]